MTKGNSTTQEFIHDDDDSSSSSSSSSSSKIKKSPNKNKKINKPKKVFCDECRGTSKHQDKCSKLDPKQIKNRRKRSEI